MSESLSVKKWGWENAAELVKSPHNVFMDHINWVKQAIVVSAIRSSDFNTTDKLIEIWELIKSKSSFWEVKIKLMEIRDFHFAIIDEKLSWDTSELKDYINHVFQQLTFDIFYWLQIQNNFIPSKENDYSIKTEKWLVSIIWFWENLSAYVHEQIITLNWTNAKFVDLKWVVPENSEELKEAELFDVLSRDIASRVEEVLKDKKIPVLPWYIPWFANGIENAIWRWYSDATAAMTSVWLSRLWYDITLEIQKSVKGMLSSDPRVVKWKKTKLIEQIDYLTAKEITGIRWAQAKLLHNQVLRKELQEAWIKVRLFDPFSDSKGTLISKLKNTESSGVEFIWGRSWVTFFSISSWKMAGEWILSQVFSIVKEYASVDIISTSETELSFTIDSWLSQKKLDEMTLKIRASLDIQEDGYENFVKYEKNKALVFCVWQNLYHSKWTLWKAATALSKWWINIEMVSQWIMERAIVFGINSKELNTAINLLHKELI